MEGNDFSSTKEPISTLADKDKSAFKKKFSAERGTSPEDSMELLTLDDQNKKLKNDSFSQDIAERKKFAQNAYSITQAWIGFLIILTFAQFLIGGEKGIVPGLSEAAFIAVFTTTTASVFGFWFLVGKYLFDTGKPDSN